MRESQTGFLILEDQTVFRGQWNGNSSHIGVGEVVFNTSMGGYQEILTDPSYYQQIIVMTAPEQGNYGVADTERESKKVWAEGFVCVNLNATLRDDRKNLQTELDEFSRPGLSDIDTRSLTLHLRDRGTPWGVMISQAEAQKQGLDSESKKQEFVKNLITRRRDSISKDWCYETSAKETKIYQGQGVKGRVALLDLGTKENILQQLLLRFKEVSVFNSRASASEILDWSPQGLVLSNGPGDPGNVLGAAAETKKLLGQVPIFGICMGHQILALALGGKTFKLKFGHRGSNHPVQNYETGEIYMTAQNHGYAVSPDLPTGVKVSQINLYDKTVEGIESEKSKAWSVQYHPEAGPGPHDSRILFDYFAKKIL